MSYAVEKGIAGEEYLWVFTDSIGTNAIAANVNDTTVVCQGYQTSSTPSEKAW